MIDNIQQHILDNIEALSEIPQDTLENIETVTAVLSLSIPANKIIIAASSLCAPIGNIFSEEINLHNAFNEEPSLNAYNLSSNAHKINYLYTNLGWYRQIDHNVPGAYRIFTNLLSYPLYEEKEKKIYVFLIMV